MDVRSTKSHLTGRHDVRHRRAVAARAQRRHARRSDGLRSDSHAERQAVPADWQGTALWNGEGVAAVRSRTSYVDDARGTFEDAHVPGAVSRFAAQRRVGHSPAGVHGIPRILRRRRLDRSPIDRVSVSGISAAGTASSRGRRRSIRRGSTCASRTRISRIRTGLASRRR